MKSKLSIVSHWLLLSTLLAIVSSCGNMSSVRNGKHFVSKSKETEEQKNIPSDSELLAIYENEPKEIRNREETPAIDANEIPIKKIPSLHDQMMELSKRQDKFDERLDNIESQNNKINQRLDDIAKLLEKSSNQKSETATTGIVEKKLEKKEQFVLYPDEKVQIKKPKSKEKKIVPITEEPPKLEEKLFREASDMVDKQDYNSAILMLLKEEQKIKDPSRLAECRYLIAKSFNSLNRYSQAKEYFAKVLASNIDYEKKAEAQAGIAEILAKNGDKEQAKEAYKKIIEKYSTTKYVIEAKKMLQKL